MIRQFLPLFDESQQLVLQNLFGTPSATNMHLVEWDKGMFISELVQQSIFPRQISLPKEDIPGRLTRPIDVPAPIPEGTYQGTKQAVTEIFQRIEQR